jgi:hypothetical protein
MPSLSFFVDEHDVHLLLDRLNADPEIAFIVPDDLPGPESRKAGDPSISWTPAFQVHRAGDGKLELKQEHRDPLRWKAVRAVNALKDGEHSLWHVPAGPLPLIEMDTGPRRLIGPEGPGYPPIPDPWAGWVGPAGFGPGCHPWIRLEIWTRHRPYTQQERTTLHRLNAFWTNEDDMLVVSGFQWTGSHFRPAPPQTLRWWNRMRNWVDRTAVKLRADPGFWAFPSALQKLKGGMRYYSRNFDLDDAIRNAEIS